MLMYGILMITVSSNGVKSAFQMICELLSGMIIPISFMPDSLIAFIKLTPFYYMQNVAFNIYTGYIHSGREIVKIIILQFIWLIVLTVIGKWIFYRQEKRIVIQGG